MQTLLWLIPALPLLGFALLALVGSRLPRGLVGAVGVGSVAVSAVLAVVIGLDLIGGAAAGAAIEQTLWTWMSVADLEVDIGLRFDALSAVLTGVVTVVGALIHLYATRFMADEEEGYARFFAYMNLFVASMLVLVLADNLLLLYLGWEGVGLCSYLLIGFWYRDEANGRAARKAFVVTRVGDAAMAVGLFMLFWQFGTFDIQQLLQLAPAELAVGSAAASAIAALLLVGALGKSAQLPLQTWLPDAMAGPTPVSALIHAATMVTAGVYLVARTHALFELAPAVMIAVAVIGAVTLLLAGGAALMQRDIKRVLAYSTMSQIGYMFLALGIGAWSAAIFHLMTHACFKALLFLGAGSLIDALDGEHDIFEMGGLRREMPTTFWTFLIASLSLTGVPLVTAGFYSKDLILWRAWSLDAGSAWLWAAGALGAFLTALYIFRVVFRVFYGELGRAPSRRAPAAMAAPMIVLAALSVTAGFVEIPATLGGFHAFSDFLQMTLPDAAQTHDVGAEALFQIISSAIALAGIGAAWLLFAKLPGLSDDLATSRYTRPVYQLARSGWGFDWLYQRAIVRPFVWFAEVNRRDHIDTFFEGIAAGAEGGHRLLERTQNGLLRRYVSAVVLGAVLLLALAGWL